MTEGEVTGYTLVKEAKINCKSMDLRPCKINYLVLRY
jgi:hypothetical protein